MRPFSWRWGFAWSDPQISWLLAYSTPWKGHLKGLYHCSSLFLANVTLSSFMGGPKKFPRCCLTACELLSKHITKQVAYKHWALIHYTSRGWEGQNHGTADSLSSEALFPRWWSFHHSHMEEGKGLLWSLFCKSTDSIHGAPPSWTDHFTSTITWWSQVAWVSLQPYGLYPVKLLCWWDPPGKNIGMDCHALLQGIFLTQGLNPCLLCLLHWQGGSG